MQIRNVSRNMACQHGVQSIGWKRQLWHIFQHSHEESIKFQWNEHEMPLKRDIGQYLTISDINICKHSKIFMNSPRPTDSIRQKQGIFNKIEFFDDIWKYSKYCINIHQYLTLFNNIVSYLPIWLYCFETFLIMNYLITWVSKRGAFAPKNNAIKPPY